MQAIANRHLAKQASRNIDDANNPRSPSVTILGFLNSYHYDTEF